MHSSSPPLYSAIVAQLFHLVVNTCYISRHFIPTLKELICTSYFLYREHHCFFKHSRIASSQNKDREATYSYYGTLQVSKYKVTILFSRSSCIKCKAFLYGTTAIATTLYAPCIRGIIGYYYCALGRRLGRLLSCQLSDQFTDPP